MLTRVLLRTRAALVVVVMASGLLPQSNAQLSRHSVLGAGVADKGAVRVTFVRPGSAAERSGIRVDDVVVSIADHPVPTASEFVSLIKRSPSGHPLAFTVNRAEKKLNLLVTLDSAPDEQDPAVDTLYEAVSIDGSLRRTLLTTPKGLDTPRPAILILGGIGCFSVDNATDPKDEYMRLAHDLSRQGFAVMRLEKSGVGDSQGPPCSTVDFNSEMHSYEAALQALQQDSHVLRERTYLLGHSIGSLMAPRVAERNQVAGVIVAEGVGRNWFEYELWNLRRQLQLAGQTPAQVDTALAMKEICMHRLLIEKQPEPDIERTEPACKDHNVYPAPAEYMQQVAALNVAEPWAHFSLPVLVVYGTADFVTVDADHQRIVDTVNATHPGSATLKLLPGMDHHLDVAGTEQEAYDLRVKRHGSGPYDEAFSVAVLDWLCLREKCAAAQQSRALKADLIKKDTPK